MGFQDSQDSSVLNMALHLACHNDRATILNVLKDFREPPARDAAPDHLWVWAELSYRRGQFPRSRAAFERWRGQPEHQEAGVLMRFLAAQRCSYIALRMGAGFEAEKELHRAEALWDQLGARQGEFEASIEAMHAHLLELEGSSEVARTRFVRAHMIAREREQFRRAATIASDIGRLLVDLDRHADALEWQDRAKGYMNGTNRDEYIDRIIDVRIAKLEKMMGRIKAARVQLEKVLARCSDGVTPETHVNALIALHDIFVLERKSKDAEALLLEATDIASQSGLLPHVVTAKRNLARLLVTRSLPVAQEQYVDALTVALRLAPTPRLMLRHLAEDVIENRLLYRSGRYTNAETYMEKLKTTLADFVNVQRPRQLGQDSRQRDRSAQGTALAAVLQEIVDPELGASRLIGCTIRSRSSGMEIEGTQGAPIRVPPQRAAILEVMMRSVDKAMSAAEIARASKSSHSYVQTTLSWFRKHGSRRALDTKKDGRHGPARYRLVTAPQEPPTRDAPR